MKKFQIIFRVLAVALFIIQFTSANSQTTTSDSIKRVNKEMINSPFLKMVAHGFIELPANSEEPIVTTQEYRIPTWRWGKIHEYVNDGVYTVINRKTLEKAYPDDISVRPIAVTKGDFVILYYMAESNDHGTINQWLITYDYNGNRIDSLEFVRVMKFCELSSRLNQDLTINQTFIDLEDLSFSVDDNGPKSSMGTRFDFKYAITKSGHFQRTSSFRYESKMYNVDDLEESSKEHPNRGIHSGNERPIGVYTIQGNEDRENNRFPIYGHYTGAN